MTGSTDTLQTVRSLSQEGYKYGFVTDIEADEAPPGLDEDTVRFISAKKEEPAWLLEWRLAAFRAWRKMTQPNWAKLHLTPIDYQAATYYSAPKQNAGPKSLDEVDPELLRTYEKFEHRPVGSNRPVLRLVGHLAARHQYRYHDRDVSDGFRDPERAKSGHSGAAAEARRADPGD